MQEKSTWILMATVLTDAASESELRKLKDVLQRDKDLNEQFTIIAAFWRQGALTREKETPVAFKKLWTKINTCYHNIG